MSFWWRRFQSRFLVSSYESLTCWITLFGMDNERVRAFCLELPHVTESVNWGHHLVFWVGDKAIGGKMFALIHLDDAGTGVVWFHCGPERFSELLEIEGIIPAPYMAKAHWVTVMRWDVLRSRELEEELRLAHALIYDKLPAKTKAIFAMPGKERNKLIRERRKALADKVATGKTKKAE